MESSISLHITSDPSLLSSMRTVLYKICETAGYSVSEINKIVLAVDEACANVIKHAYKNEREQPITINCSVGNGLLEIEILDNGEPVDVKKIKSRELDEIRPGGLGVYLMKSVMDTVTYSGSKQGNSLYMSKQLPKKG